MHLLKHINIVLYFCCLYYTVSLNSRFRTLSNWTIFTMQEAMEWTSSLRYARIGLEVKNTIAGLSMKRSD